jgi:hypothetical protein
MFVRISLDHFQPPSPLLIEAVSLNPALLLRLGMVAPEPCDPDPPAAPVLLLSPPLPRWNLTWS